jgi:hypothetical protein
MDASLGTVGGTGVAIKTRKTVKSNSNQGFTAPAVYLKSYKSGLADTEIQQLSARIIDQLSANHSVGLTFVSVDGDPGYQAVFD